MSDKTNARHLGAPIGVLREGREGLRLGLRPVGGQTQRGMMRVESPRYYGPHNFAQGEPMTVTDAEWQRLRDRVYKLQAQVDFLYQHLGISFTPDVTADDPRIVDALKKNDILGAMKVHRQLYNSDAGTAQEAVLEIKG